MTKSATPESFLGKEGGDSDVHIFDRTYFQLCAWVVHLVRHQCMDERICLDVAGNFYNLCSQLGLLWKNAAMPAIWGHRMTNDLKKYYMSLPTNIQELQEKCYAERLARRKVEAHYERQLKHHIEELKAENIQLKNQLSNNNEENVMSEDGTSEDATIEEDNSISWEAQKLMEERQRLEEDRKASIERNYAERTEGLQKPLRPLDVVEIHERLRQAESILHPLLESKQGVWHYALFCQNMLSILSRKQSQQSK
jgi:hypothetical protein